MTIVVKRLVLDALMPRELSMIKLSKALASSEGVQEVEIVVDEVDSQTQTLRVTLRGPAIDHDHVWKIVGNQGVSIKGVDEITAGEA